MKIVSSLRIDELAYFLVVGLLALSLLGLGNLRYSIYVAPLLLLPLWLFRTPFALNITREVAPFVFFLGVGLLYAPALDVVGWKKLFFVLVYTSIFLMFNLRGVKVDFRLLNVIFVLVFLVVVADQKGLLALLQFQFNLVRSEGTFESTLAFPFGLFGAYFIIQKRYGWAAANALLTLLAFKRIVFVGLALILIIQFLPAHIRRVVLHPIVVVSGVLSAALVMVLFGDGAMESFFWDYFGVSPDAFSMGRQSLWAQGLQEVSFSFWQFTVMGVGPGMVQSAILEAEGVTRGGLLHSDVLTLYLELGGLGFIVFFMLLVGQPTLEQRSLAVFLVVLFLTDNVMIYQHVMLLYLWMAWRLRAENSRNIQKAVKWRPEFGVEVHRR